MTSLHVTVEIEVSAPGDTMACVYGRATVEFDADGCPEIGEDCRYTDASGREVTLTRADEERVDEALYAKAEDERAQG